jgi:non-specific serine/threonine protein kinase
VTRRLYRERYEPLELVAEGGQGAVWQALDHVHERRVALKIRDAGASDRAALLREARTLLDIRPHPGLPLARDDFFDDDRYVIVMDWIEGRNLADEPPPFEDALRALEDVADALDHLHAHRPPVLHLDVKPANVIVTPEGRAVLVDLGLGGAAASSRFGTPGFHAPETASAAELTPAADVYGLAATAHVLLLGSRPEPGEEPDWSSVPPEFRDDVRLALSSALATDPRLRPPSAGTFVRSLRPPQTPHNLPAPLTSFVGRDHALADLRRTLPTTRLLTLTGAGGSGKTRLALELARSVLPSHASGVWFVELAALTDAALVEDAIANAMGVQTEAGSVRDAITAELGAGRQLLVLDNCEHLADQTAALAEDLLRACPDLTLLATSREPLRAYGERPWTVPPLSGTEAERLFRDRAAMAAGDDHAIASICERLEGIPLALELAAAQSFVSGAAEVASRLDRALGLLTGGARTAPRHETLRATIDWSHDLLPPDARTALRRLSVFAGRFTATAARDVCDAEGQLATLVSASLLIGEGERFRMLEVVRQYAAEKLGETGEEAERRSRHAAWYAELSDPPYETLAGPGWVDWLDELSDEHANLQAALTFACDAEPATAARLAACLGRYWLARGHWHEGGMWIERTAEFTPVLEVAARARLLRVAGIFAHASGANDLARRRLDEALELYRGALDDRVGASSCLNTLAIVARDQSDYAASRSYISESLAIKRETGDRLGVATSLVNLANIHIDFGEYETARPLLEESLSIHRDLEDKAGEATALDNLALVLVHLGDLPAARSYNERALAMALETDDAQRMPFVNATAALLVAAEGDLPKAAEIHRRNLDLRRQQGDQRGVGLSLQALAEVSLAQKDLDAAERYGVEALEVRLRLGERINAAWTLWLLAGVAAERGDMATAARKLGEAESHRRACGLDVPPPIAHDVARLVARVREALGDEAFEGAQPAG